MDTPPDVTFEFSPLCFTRLSLTAVRSHWEAKRRGRRMPSRADIVPRELTDWLPQILLVDVLADDFRYRLLGTGLTRYFPVDAEGETFSQALSPFGDTTLAATLQIYRCVVATGEPVLIKGPGHYFKQNAKSFQAFLAPLGDTDDEVTMILGAFEFEGKKTGPT